MNTPFDPAQPAPETQDDWEEQRARIPGPNEGSIHESYHPALQRQLAALRESEARYRSLFENSVLGIYRTTPDGRILAANPTLVSMLGYEYFAELATRNLEQLDSTTGIRRAEFLEIIEREGEVRGLEAIWPRKDGTSLFIRENARAIRSPAGVTLYYEGTVEDITEHKRIEEAEREQRLMAEALYRTAAALAGTLDFDELLDRILAEVGSVLPHDGSRIMLLDGDSIHIVRARGGVLHPGDRSLSGLSLPLNQVANLRQILQSDRSLAIPSTRDYPAWYRIEGLEWIRSNASAPIHSRGQIIGFLGLDSRIAGFYNQEDADRLQAFADQAGVAIENARLYDEIRRHASGLEAEAERLEQRVAERTAALHEAMQKLTELDRMKSQFVSNVSHELRTPLANIRLYLSLLRHGKPEKTEQYMATLEREANLLQRLIEDLLELSRLDLVQAEPDWDAVDVSCLVEALAGDRAALLRAKGLLVQTQLAAGLPAVKADPRMLTQLLTNLMTNAMNYTPPGGIITIGTGLQEAAGRAWVTFYVRDTGPGIAEAELPHLFERFYRGASARQTATPGTGLGLSICQEIALRHEGRIEVVSQNGAGSTFTVWLPALAGRPQAA